MLLLQRVSRAELFSMPAFDAEKSQFDNSEVGFLKNNNNMCVSFGVLVLMSCSF